MIVLALSMGVAIFAGVRLALELRDYRAAGQEYEALREQYAPPAAAPTQRASDTAPTPTPPADQEAVQPSALPTAPPDLSSINPDYIGWLRIGGTEVDYPLVQGEDNDKYLKTTFEGESNRLGAIFMDCRCKDGFDAPYAILYGHNAKNGSMFGGLSAYLDSSYLTEHPTLSIVLPDGTERIYQSLAVRKTDVTDSAYKLDGMTEKQLSSLRKSIGAPEDSAHLLALSTCTSGGSDDERVLVFAVYIP